MMLLLCVCMFMCMFLLLQLYIMFYHILLSFNAIVSQAAADTVNLVQESVEMKLTAVTLKQRLLIESVVGTVP